MFPRTKRLNLLACLFQSARDLTICFLDCRWVANATTIRPTTGGLAIGPAVFVQTPASSQIFTRYCRLVGDVVVLPGFSSVILPLPKRMVEDELPSLRRVVVPKPKGWV